VLAFLLALKASGEIWPSDRTPPQWSFFLCDAKQIPKEVEN